MNEITDPKLFFWLRSGRPLRSIEELMHYLPETKGDEFHHHVNDQKNDFANWVGDVFEERELAEKIRGTRTASDMLSVLVDFYEQGDETLEEQPESSPEKEPELEEAFFDAPKAPEPLDDIDPEVLAEKNDKIADKFDEAAKRLEFEQEEDESLTKKLEVLRERERELRQEISEARKAGYDPFMADIILQRFNSRLELAKVTHEEQDFAMVEDTLKQAKAELLESQEEEPVNVKKEIEALAK